MIMIEMERMCKLIVAKIGYEIERECVRETDDILKGGKDKKITRTKKNEDENTWNNERKVGKVSEKREKNRHD